MRDGIGPDAEQLPRADYLPAGAMCVDWTAEMSELEEREFRVLHTLRCVGAAGVDRLATAADLTPGETGATLSRLSDRRLVESMAGPFGGWSLTESGRATDQRLLHDELERASARDHVRGCYESFLELNPTLLEICSEWQICRVGDGRVLNDHSDRDYDARALSRLPRIDQAAQEICADLAGRLARFGIYSRRLGSALERAMGGDHSYVADSLDSYHSVWFHLHEDLLTTLGISRDSERRDPREGG